MTYSASVAKFFMDRNTDLVNLFALLAEDNDAQVFEILNVGGKSLLDDESNHTE